MGFKTDKIPYELNIYLDLTNHKFDPDSLYDMVTSAENQKLDGVAVNLSVKDQQKRKDSINNFTQPIFLDDYSLFSYEWKSKVIGKLHKEDLKDLDANFQLLKMDLDYSLHVSCKFLLADFHLTDNFLFVKLFKKFLNDHLDKTVCFIVDLSADALIQWRQAYAALGHPENVSVCLRVTEDLPESHVLTEFCAHNVKCLYVPLSIFVSNKNGFPVLSKLHQDYIKYVLSYRIDVIFCDDINLLTSDFGKLSDYYLYITHLFSVHREFKNTDYVLQNFLDVFQIPLQPLKDNLPSQTYECFEEDVPKYDLYQQALEKAFINYKHNGWLNISNDKEKIPMYPLHICVLGGGRGPLVRRVVNVIKNSGVKEDSVDVTCVEKNRNAFNTLLHLKAKEPSTFGNVNFVFCDMRQFKPQNKINVVVSELLGSFGDNELSPECLMDIQQYLAENSIMIPSSYTSYVRPIKRLNNNYQSPYVVLLHKAHYPVESPHKCLTFSHPVNAEDLNEYLQMKFEFKRSEVIHGFAGYFRAVLYDDVVMSTLPEDHSADMHSWFPIYFPSLSPVEVGQDQVLAINISRENDGKKAWYEWNFEIHSQKKVSTGEMHNQDGLFAAIYL